MPGSVGRIDETMVPRRGRLSFRRCIPGNVPTYGVKMYKVADTNGYTWNLMVYKGKQNLATTLGHPQTVTIQLLIFSGRTYFDDKNIS